jgi:phosphoribosylglycinamide formyltransferase-1
MLIAFVYDFPHKKSYEGLLKLILNGHRPDMVFGAPYKELSHKVTPIRRIAIKGLAYEPAKFICGQFGIPYFTLPHNSADITKILEDAKPDIGVILGARILKQVLIEQFTTGILNMHPGCLPSNRGLDNIKWAIVDNLPQGVSTHLIDSQIDLGKLVEISLVPVYLDDCYLDILLRIQNVELQSLISVLEKLKSKKVKIMQLSDGKYNTVMRNETESVMENKFEKYKRDYTEILDQYQKANFTYPWSDFN